MKLYYAPGACSLAVHVALRELGMSFTATSVDMAAHRTADGVDYRSLSPRGYVPLLQLDDGSCHTEVAALLQYLADTDPQQALIGPVGSARRLAVIEWLAFVSSELHKLFSPWLFQKETADSTRQLVKEKLASRFRELDVLLERQEFLAGQYSVADAYAFTVLNWAKFVSLSLKPYPHLGNYLQRVARRTAVQEAMKAEGLLQ